MFYEGKIKLSSFESLFSWKLPFGPTIDSFSQCHHAPKTVEELGAHLDSSHLLKILGHIHKRPFFPLNICWLLFSLGRQIYLVPVLWSPVFLRSLKTFIWKNICLRGRHFQPVLVANSASWCVIRITRRIVLILWNHMTAEEKKFLWIQSQGWKPTSCEYTFRKMYIRNRYNPPRTQKLDKCLRSLWYRMWGKKTYQQD